MTDIWLVFSRDRHEQIKFLGTTEESPMPGAVDEVVTFPAEFLIGNTYSVKATPGIIWLPRKSQPLAK